MEKTVIRYFRDGVQRKAEGYRGTLTQEKFLKVVENMQVGDEVMFFVPNHSVNDSMPSFVLSYYGPLDNPKLFIIAPKQLGIRRMHSAQIRPVRMCVVGRPNFVSSVSVDDGTSIAERVVTFVSSTRADQANAPLELIGPRKNDAFKASFRYYVPPLASTQ